MRKAGQTGYSLLKYAEGGHSQKDVKEMAEHYGFKVQFSHSILVGHFDVFVNTKDKRKLKNFERNVIGW